MNQNCTPRPPGLRVSEEGRIYGSLKPVYNCTPEKIKNSKTFSSRQDARVLFKDPKSKKTTIKKLAKILYEFWHFNNYSEKFFYYYNQF